MELKRFLELRIKNGSRHNAPVTAKSTPTSTPAASSGDGYFLDDVAQRLREGSFDVNGNTVSFSSRTRSELKESLVLPNLKLRVVQEALRIALEVIFKPHFSKISHGCRSGRGRAAALKYICKEDACLYGFVKSMFDAGVLNLELSMKYEALQDGVVVDGDRSCSTLRGWFRRQLDCNGVGIRGLVEEKSGVKVYCCRFMDEIFFAVSGSRDCAVNFKSEVESFLKDSLMLDVGDQADVLPCEGPRGVRFLGTLVKRNARNSPAVKAVHKLKEKVELLLCKGLRLGIMGLVACFRKSGMETDHWYKHLLKIWMQDVQAKNAKNKKSILSKCVAEPALPQELKDSFYEFMKQAEQYISTEADSILKLLPNNNSSTEQVMAKTEIIAPINAMKKRLLRYGLTTSKGFPRSANFLIIQDTSEIIDWFSGIACRWLKWYENCANFSEIKLLISDQVRKSCIRTLAAKYRVHEMEIEKQFDEELSRLPLTRDTEKEMMNEALDVQAFDNDEALTYGIAYSGCLSSAPRVYTLHVMERQKFPSWKTGFSTCIHLSLIKGELGCMKALLKMRRKMEFNTYYFPTDFLDGKCVPLEYLAADFNYGHKQWFVLAEGIAQDIKLTTCHLTLTSVNAKDVLNRLPLTFMVIVAKAMKNTGYFIVKFKTEEGWSGPDM
ncbi:Domain X [Sesbania bispinosa]|nr:Domain X [Sesbania bispinosa]